MNFHHSLVGQGWNCMIYAGSAMALTVGGTLAAVSPHEPITAIGVITALTGAITAVTALIGGHVVPILRVWLATVHAERLAKIQRHDLANQLQLLKFEKEELRQQLQVVTLQNEDFRQRLDTNEQRINTTEANLSRALALANQNRRDIGEANVVAREAKAIVDQKVAEVKQEVANLTGSGTFKATSAVPPADLP